MKKKKCIPVLKKNFSVMFGPLSINSNNLNTDNENIDFTIVYEQ